MNAYYVAILQGSVLTVGVSLCALLVAIVLGLLGAAAKLSGRPVLASIAAVYTTVIRGVPDLVVMLLVFYGGTIGLNHLLELAGSKATIDINPFAAGDRKSTRLNSSHSQISYAVFCLKKNK